MVCQICHGPGEITDRSSIPYGRSHRLVGGAQFPYLHAYKASSGELNGDNRRRALAYGIKYTDKDY